MTIHTDKEPVAAELLSLAERVESATEGSRNLLEAAYTAIFGTTELASYSDWQDGIFTPEQKRRQHFDRMLHAEAYLEAAAMLVPDECRMDVGESKSGFWVAHLIRRDDRRSIGIGSNRFTPALALTEACLRARAALAENR